MTSFRKYRNLSRAGESGQALVETALTMPLLVIMLIGVVELGRVSYAAIEIANAAKAAVQYGAQNPGTAGSIADHAAADALIRSMAVAEARDYNISLATSDVVVNRSCSCAKAGSASASACDGTCVAGGGYLIQTLTVNTSTPYSPVFHIPGLPTSFRVHGRAVQEVLF